MSRKKLKILDYSFRRNYNNRLLKLALIRLYIAKFGFGKQEKDIHAILP
jgi:hypothetical protein